MGRLFRSLFIFIIYSFLYIPIIILVTNSFNEDPLWLDMERIYGIGMIAYLIMIR